MNVRTRSLGKSLVLVVLAALVLAACGSLEAEPGMALDGEISTSITWGQPADGAYDNVGTLLFVQNGVGYYSCTGTMIAPRIMLTAGHCVAAEGNVNDVTYVRFEDDALSGIGDHASTQEWLDSEWTQAQTVVAHPEYADYAAFPNTFDIGVVILPAGVGYTPTSGFGEIPALGFLAGLRGRERQDFTAVGYGAQGTLRPFASNDYEKRQGDVRLLELNSRFNGFGTQSAKFSNNPGVGGGTCYGDSGGPTFYRDTNFVVAVTSFGWAKNGNCVGNDFNFRTDTPTAQTFIDDMLDLYGE